MLNPSLGLPASRTALRQPRPLALVPSLERVTARELNEVADLQVLLGQALADHSSEVASAQLTTRVTLCEGSQCRGTRFQVRALLDAMFHHAVRVTRPGGHLGIAVSVEDERIQVAFHHGSNETAASGLGHVLETFRSYSASVMPLCATRAPRIKITHGEAEGGQSSTIVWLPAV